MYDLESLFGGDDGASGLVGDSKGSKHITAQAPHQKRPDNGFVGLINQGATCYLNSMLQMLYMTPELRNGIYGLSPEQLDVPKEDPSSVKIDVKGDDEFSDLPALEDLTPTLHPLRASAGAPSPVPPTAQVDESMVEDYVSMGFGEDQVRRALVKFRGRLQQSEIIDWLLSGEDRTDDQELGAIVPLGLEEESVDLNPPVDPALLAQKMLDYSNSTKDHETTTSTTTTTTSTQADGNIIEVTPANDWWDMHNLSEESLGCALIEKPTEKGSEEDSGVELKEISSSHNPAQEEVKTDAEKKSDEKKQDGKKRFLFSLQKLFANMQKCDKSALATDQITNSFGWSGSETLQQHDVHELFRLFFDAIERSLVAVKGANIIYDLYRGEFVNQVNTRPEDFHDVSVVVKSFAGLTDSLAEYVADESLAGDNRYFCEQCATKVDAKRGQKFRTLPPFLMFALQRFEYDWQHDKRNKITSQYSFPLVLDMAPYLENADETKQAKGKEAGTIPLEGNIVQPVFDPLSPHLYELFAVIIHQGGAYGGHYHAYVRNLIDPESASCSPSTVNTQPQTYGPSNESTETNTTTATVTNPDSVPPTLTQPTESPMIPSTTEVTATTGPTYAPYTMEDLLNQPWFDFDDTRVSPIPVTSIASQYGGKTEYMIAYRKVSLPSKTYSAPSVPPHLEAEIEKNNVTLNSERINFDISLYKLTLGLRVLKNYDIKDGGMLEKSKPEPEGSEEAQVTIEVDLRDTVENLKQKIVQEFANDVPSWDKLVVQEITSRTGWLKLAVPLTDNAITLKQAGLRDGASILAWVGQEALGVNMEGPPITIDVLYYYGTHEPIEFQVTIAELSTLKKLKEAVSLKAEIPEENMSLCRVGAHEVVSLLALADSTPLSLAHISDKSTVTVEDLPEGHYSFIELLRGFLKCDFFDIVNTPSYAVEHLSKLFEVFIVDETSVLRAVSLPISVRIEKDATVIELKQKALIAVNSNVAVDKCRLRRTQSLGFPGTIIGNEKNSLAAVGIQGGHRLILELGEPANQDSFTIRFLVDFGDYSQLAKSLTKRDKITVPRRTTFAECKAKILQLLESDVPPTSSRLRKTDAFESAGEIILDETRTLEDMGVHHEDLVILEIGKAAARGAITLHTLLYLPPTLIPKSNSSESTTPAKPIVLVDELASGLANALTNSPHIFASPQPVSSELNLSQTNLIPTNLIPTALAMPTSINSPRTSSPTPTPSVPKEPTTPLLDSESAALTTSAPTPSAVSTPEIEHEVLEISAFSPALWMQHSPARKRSLAIRLGNVEVDYMKTTIEELKEQLHKLDILSAVATPQHLRVWFKEKLLKDNGFILKKYLISYDAQIIVQTLTEPDPIESTLLYIHRLDPANPTAPITPPIELFVPLLQTIPILRDFVSRKLDIPIEYISMAKYTVVNKLPVWKLLAYDDPVGEPEPHERLHGHAEMLPPVLGPHSLERRGRHARKRANSSNRQAMVKDGDIIGVIDTRASADSLEFFKKYPPSTATTHTLSRRHHSSFLSSSPTTARSSKPKRRSQEAVLKINLDWE